MCCGPTGTPWWHHRRPRPPAVALHLQAIRSMWEFACVLEFFRLYRTQLKLNREFSAEDLEEALIMQAGSGLLQDIHQELMNPKGREAGHRTGYSTTANLPGEWIREMMRKLKYHRKLLPQDGERRRRAGLPTLPTNVPGNLDPLERLMSDEFFSDEDAYARMAAEDRVVILKTICDIRMDR